MLSSWSPRYLSEFLLGGKKKLCVSRESTRGVSETVSFNTTSYMTYTRAPPKSNFFSLFRVGNDGFYH
jgi:hypothetical protein